MHLRTPDEIEAMFFEDQQMIDRGANTVVVFHCEFSQVRGPRRRVEPATTTHRPRPCMPAQTCMPHALANLCGGRCSWKFFRARDRNIHGIARFQELYYRDAYVMKVCIGWLFG